MAIEDICVYCGEQRWVECGGGAECMYCGRCGKHDVNTMEDCLHSEESA